MEGELSVFHFPFQTFPRVSVGMELEFQLFPKGFQVENLRRHLWNRQQTEIREREERVDVF